MVALLDLSVFFAQSVGSVIQTIMTPLPQVVEHLNLGRSIPIQTE